MNLIKMLTKKIINLDVDNRFAALNGYEVSNLPCHVEFYVWQLIFAYGSKKTSMFNPSWRNKFFDYDYLVEKISNDRDFKICVDRIRCYLGSEDLGNYSEAFGEAFSLLLVQRLFNTKLEKINKIKTAGPRSRPDFKAETENGDSFVFEAKGTIDSYTHQLQRQNGKNQANTSQANIKALLGVLVKENTRSQVAVIDPPGDDFSFSRQEVLEMEAESLARLFNFLGQKELSRYFYLMYRRIKDEKFEEVEAEKERIFREITERYEEINYAGKVFKGQFTKVGGGYLFVGVDEGLVYYSDFFNAVTEVDFITDENNNAMLYRNKILVKQFDDLNEFKRVPEYSEYLKEIKVSDFHYSSNDVSLNLLKKIIASLGLRVSTKEIERKALFVQKKGRLTIVVFKKFFTSDIKRLERSLSLLSQKFKIFKKRNILLISPNKLPFEIYEDIKIMDRSDLKKCLDDQETFLKYF